MQNKQSYISWRNAVFAFFLLTLLAGFFNFTRYGISWDEPMQRDMGNLCYDYVTGKSDALFSIQNKYHNATWEFINVLPERLLGLEDGKSVYYSRHLLNYLAFWTGAVFFYLLAFRAFKSRAWALLAVAMLFVSPRIFAHAFYNSKDLPFLAFFVISIYLGTRFIDRPGIKRMIPLALVSGALFGMRILGIMVPFCIAFFFVLNIFTRHIPLRSLRFLLFYLLAYPVCMYVFLPVLWPDPLFHFGQAFSMHSHFPYEDKVLFMGDFLNPQHLPWYYVPVWILVSVPLFWQACFAAGVVAGVLLLATRHFYMLRHQWIIVMSAGWFFIPWMMVVLLNSHIYDEWRHLFFTYPAFILVGVFGIKSLRGFIWRHGGKKMRFLTNSFLGILFFWQFSVTLFFMLRHNPHQYVYFNLMAGKDPGRNFDMDYWGLSYRNAWQYLVEHKSTGITTYEYENPPGEFNRLWFSSNELKGLEHADYRSCDYFMTNYRWHRDYPAYSEKLYSLNVDGMEIMTIFVNPDAPKNNPAQ